MGVLEAQPEQARAAIIGRAIGDTEAADIRRTIARDLGVGLCEPEVEHRPLLSAICTEASKRPSQFGTASCSQLLWALSRLNDGVSPSAISALASRLTEIAHEGLNPQNLLYALGALAKLPKSLEPSLPSLLCSAAARTAKSLTANKLGIAAWALSRPLVHDRLNGEVKEAWKVALRQRSSQVVAHLGWRSIGYVETALRKLSGFREDDELMATLTKACALSVDGANERCVRRNAAPYELLMKHRPWERLKGNGKSKGGGGGGGCVLVAGFDPDAALDAAIKRSGYRVIHWRRFATSSASSLDECTGVAGAPADLAAAVWPSSLLPEDGTCEGGVNACFVRWPWYAAGDAALMMLKAISSISAANAPLYLVGNLDEGADGAASVISQAYGNASVIETTSSGAVLCHAEHTALLHRTDVQKLRIDGWKAVNEMDIPKSITAANAIVESSAGTSAPPSSSSMATVSWTTYPGLFAAGGLEPMSCALSPPCPRRCQSTGEYWTRAVGPVPSRPLCACGRKARL